VGINNKQSTSSNQRTEISNTPNTTQQNFIISLAHDAHPLNPTKITNKKINKIIVLLTRMHNQPVMLQLLILGQSEGLTRRGGHRQKGLT
jgi:hypothetical protein